MKKSVSLADRTRKVARTAATLKEEELKRKEDKERRFKVAEAKQGKALAPKFFKEKCLKAIKDAASNGLSEVTVEVDCGFAAWEKEEALGEALVQLCVEHGYEAKFTPMGGSSELEAAWGASIEISW